MELGRGLAVRAGLREAEPADEVTPGGGAPPATRRELGRALVVVAAVLVVANVVAALSVAHLPWDDDNARSFLFPGQPWFEAWVHWDSGWYFDIARDGYSFVPGIQSTVAFFPAYPLAMRALGAVLGDHLVAGIVLTWVAGLAAAVLLFAWLRTRLRPPAAWTAFLLFALYPYSLFLYGAVYADALFVAAVLAAFLLVERDRPVLAGLAGAVASAARPLGIVVLLGLALRVVERRGGWRSLKARDAGVLLAGAGLGGFALYCWVRFGSPVAFLEAQAGWGQEAGWRTWAKLQFFRDVTDFRSPVAWLAFVAHALVAVVGLALVPAVVRRHGWSYGLYTLLVLGLAALSSKNFFGMGRYALAAFPCFAVAGEWLAARTRGRILVLAASAGGLLVATSFFARGHYLS